MTDPFDELLIHTCTVVTATPTGAKTAYNRPVTAQTEATLVPCRYSRPRFSETTDQAGIRQKVDGKLFIKFTEAVDLASTIKDIKDANGAAVIAGTFEVVEVLAASGREGHHREVLMRRATS